MSLVGRLPRYRLAFLPTPVHPLPRLSVHLAGRLTGGRSGAISLWIKRDDQTGLAGGGNKTRKLEFLVADALAAGADTLITTGAVQSNHCRQTAAAAAQAGLACSLVLGGERPRTPNGNLLLDELLGAEVVWTTREQRLERLNALAADLRQAGRRPYLITYGGSDPVGAVGYAAALEELLSQVSQEGPRIRAIVVASSSGGTQAGLIAGAWALGWDVPILGVSIDAPAARLQALVAELASATCTRLGCPHSFAPADILVDDSCLGAGYGIVGPLERRAIRAMAQTEGIMLDPVYTGRAFGGLLKTIEQRQKLAGKTFASLDGDVLFWHTGGMTALFAYADDLVCGA